MAKIEITVPFGADAKMLIDPEAVNATADQAMEYIADHVPYESEELIDILTSAVCIYHHHKGACTFGEALETAIIWSRG